MGEYADMALQEQELEGILNLRRRPLRRRFIRWLEHRNRRQLAKSIAALTGYSPTVCYLVLLGARDDLLVTRQALERATATNTNPRPSEVDRATCRWERTLGWERIRLLAEARAVVLRGVKRLLEKRHG